MDNPVDVVCFRAGRIHLLDRSRSRVTKTPSAQMRTRILLRVDGTVPPPKIPRIPHAYIIMLATGLVGISLRGTVLDVEEPRSPGFDGVSAFEASDIARINPWLQNRLPLLTIRV